MALRMDAAASEPPNHHRTAVPRRTSPPPEPSPQHRQQLSTGKGAAPSRSASSASSAKRPLAAAAAAAAATTRKRGAVAIAAAAAAAAAAMAAAAAASAAASAAADSTSAKGGGSGGGGGGSAVPGGGGGAVKGRDRSKKSGVESGVGPRGAGGAAGGGSGGSGSTSGAARKRVRVTDKKLGEFAVVLQPFDGDHNDICERCDKGGDLLCCDFCNVVYHLHCVTPKLAEPPNELWLCPACTAEVTGRQINKRRRTDHDGGRSASPGVGGAAGGGRHQVQDRLPNYGVKAENDAFRASVLYKNQTMDIGLFPTAQAAARAYDRKALSLFGDAALCNFPADEQVEVEGVATDGSTVKGVVRSFHQWRAEMQWGNKKRHLGFFDRLDHASHAYNRAALYANGPETALNPTKEGYLPPPLTGRSVRVPRNKLFVQQLPLPLIALSQVEGAGNSAEYERRRQQMQGKYHVPLIGENHQVSSLPPLPPPSRPWAGIRPGSATAAREAAAAAGDKMLASSSPRRASVALAPAELNSGSSAVLLPPPSSKLPSVVEDGVDVDIVAASTPDGAASRSAADSPRNASAPPVAGGKGKGPAKAVPDDTGGRASCCLPLPVARPLAMASRGDGHRPAAASAPATVFATEIAPTAGPSSTGVAGPPAAAVALACSQKGPCEAAVPGSGGPPPVSEEKAAATQMADGTSICDIGTASPGLPAEVIREISGDSSLGDAGASAARAVSPASPTPVVTEAVDEGVSATVVAAASSGSGSDSSSSSGDGDGGSSSGDGDGGSSSGGVPLTRGISSLCLCPAEVSTTERFAVADTYRSQEPLRTGGGESGTNKSAAVGMDASPTNRHEQSAESGEISGLPSTGGYDVEGWQGLGAAPAPSPGTPASSPPPTPVLTCAAHGSRSTRLEGAAGEMAGARREPVAVAAAETTGSDTKPSAGGGVSATPTPAPSPGVAGRKRKLPPSGSRSASGSGGEGIAGGSGNPGRGSAHGGAGALPRPPRSPPPPPLPRDLTFEDVAELVWDPRAGPKPRGVAEVRGPEGTVVNRSALERAMWERDSTLLERVAPAHAEKAMQVLQMHRHDVERAAQMLTVRHGIHVVGLSSVRTTRNKRAELQQQQQQQQQALHPGPSPVSALAGRSGGGKGGKGGGGRSSGGASFEGWQSAATATPGQAAAAAAAGAAAGAASAGPAAAAAAPRRGKKTDAQGVTREEAKLAGDAFMRHGRDLNAVQEELGWKKSRVVEYYYCIWKYSPAYQVWKATRHQAGLPGVGTGAGPGGPSSGAPSASAGGLTGGGLLHATSDGMRWRGSRLRTLKTPSSQ